MSQEDTPGYKVFFVSLFSPYYIPVHRHVFWPVKFSGDCFKLPNDPLILIDTLQLEASTCQILSLFINIHVESHMAIGKHFDIASDFQ